MAINYLDKTGLLYVITKIKALLTGYVPKDGSKVLSDNNFTDALKNKLDGIAAEATKVIVDAGLTQGGTNPVQGGAIYTAIQGILNSPAFTGTPTAPTATAGTSSTQIATTAFVSAAITAAVAGLTGFHFEKVQTLPATGETNVIYLVPKTGSTNDVYDEYYWDPDSSQYEYMGTTAVDLSDYVQFTDLVAITNSEIDAMFT